MATEDGFQPDRSPIFLSVPAEETGQPDIEKSWDSGTISSRILKATVLAVAVTGIGIAVVSIGNPAALVANVTDWWADKPALQPIAEPASMSAVQAFASMSTPPTKMDAPARDETSAAVETAGQRKAETGQSQAENGQFVTEELFKQFQAWAAEEETRAQADRARPVQAVPARVAQDAQAQQVQPVKKQRRVRSVQNARAEARPQRRSRALVREQQDARAQVPPPASPRTQEQSVQNDQAPSFLQSLGLRNN